MIKIKSFDIGQADCFLIEILHGSKYFNLLVDCGRVNMKSEIENELKGKFLNGVVITHVDDDHISGIIDIIKDKSQKLISDKTFFLYNKYDESLISYKQGRDLFEEIRKCLTQKLLMKSYARNYQRENKVIERRRDNSCEFPVSILSAKQRGLMDKRLLKCDMVYITLLSPTIEILKKYMRNWDNAQTDSKTTNNSSIVFLLEYNDTRLLMLGDAEFKYAAEALKKIKDITKIDCVKLSHHGAEKSNCGIEILINQYKCKTFIVTIPLKQDTEKLHPDRKLIERITDNGGKIYTSTKYQSSFPHDIIHRIEYTEEITL